MASLNERAKVDYIVSEGHVFQRLITCTKVTRIAG